MELLLPLAERLGIRIGPELHAPWTVDSPEVVAYREIYQKLGSPLLGFVPDFGSCAQSLPPGYVEYLLGRGMPRPLMDLAAETWGGRGDAARRRGEFQRRAATSGADPSVISALSVIFAMMSPQDPRAWLSVMPHIIHMHAKFYGVNSSGIEPAIAYDQLLPIFVDGGYEGYMSSQWEGHLYSRSSGFEEVCRFHDMAKRILAAHSRR